MAAGRKRRVGSWCEFLTKRQKKLCKLKLFHYNYYSTQRFPFISSYERWKPHRTFVSSASFLSCSLLACHISEEKRFRALEKLFYEFLMWNWFSCIFEFSLYRLRRTIPFLILLPLAFRPRYQQIYIFHLFLLLKRKRFFCFMWRPNNRREEDWRRKSHFMCEESEETWALDGKEIQPQHRSEVKLRSPKRINECAVLHTDKALHSLLISTWETRKALTIKQRKRYIFYLHHKFNIATSTRCLWI